jgi:hypothetical protein
VGRLTEQDSCAKEWSCWLVDSSRRLRVWNLLAAEVGRCGQPVTIEVTCHVAVRALAVDGVTVTAVGPDDIHISVFATSVLGRRLGELESTLGEGPGWQAPSEAAPVLASDVQRYDAWPLVSVHLAVSLSDALARLRGHAFAHGQSISAVAHEIVQGRLRLDEGDTDD